jgi:putative transposase
VFCRLRYRLTLRDLSAFLPLRGIAVSHEAAIGRRSCCRSWQMNCVNADMGRKPGARWYVDETYLKVRARWVYLYRAIDRDGNLIDAMLSEHRDNKTAKDFFRSAKATIGFLRDRVTTDGHGSYPRAIRMVLGWTVLHGTSAYSSNRLEQGHRGIKGRIRCMRGFKNHAAAGHFCREHGDSAISSVLAADTTRSSRSPSADPASSKVFELRATSCGPLEGSDTIKQDCIL